MKLWTLWRHGDPEGLAATEERVARASAVINEMRELRLRNHLGEALRLTFRQPRERTR